MSIVESSKLVLEVMAKQKYYLFGDCLVEPVKHYDTGSTLFKAITNGSLKHKIRNIFDDPENIVRGVADHILNDPALPFSRVSGLVTTPTFRPDFSLITKPGYDPQSKLYYAPDAELQKWSFSTDAIREDAVAGYELLQELIVDFPFTSAIDRLTYLGFLLTLFLRSAIPDIVPALMLDGNDRSVGKGLLSNILSIIVYFLDAAITSAPTSKPEWCAVIDSILESGATFQVIDNITGTLQNDDLASVLTARRKNVRIKGITKMKGFPVNVVWVLNGNNLHLSSDMAERMVRCRMEHPDAKSRNQEDFVIWKKYGCDIPTLLRTERAKYMQACLDIVCGWKNDGAVRREKNLAMAKYRTWESVVGGIFDWLVGKGQFLANHREHTTAVDTEREERITFLTQLMRVFQFCGTEGISASDIEEKVFPTDGHRSELRGFVPPSLLAKNQGKSFLTAVGLYLTTASTLKQGGITVVKTTANKVTTYTINQAA